MSAAHGVWLPLSELRKRLDEAGDDAGREHWRAALREDPRAGAKALLRSLDRRIDAQRAERSRMRALLARRDILHAAGARYVAGVDEVGVGPLAGPVVAAAVVLPDRVDLPGLDDSKRVGVRRRERLASAIHAQAVAVAVAEVAPEEIDRLNVHHAALLAMRRAVEALAVRPDHVLVDARTIPGIRAGQTAIVHGDALDASIAAASIIAKVHRDALLRELEIRHPGYGFARNAGYPTPEHLAALRELGPSPVHRRSFAPVAMCGETR
ncbi:MAG: ribonuclease HII [Deltaproteobacteria bacterium]|nr:ribonuclease HII [Deltaproteobacteria bacterium]